ncbi:MAG TPA: hypothetical protein VLV78_04240 [Thermoanaerobaculia bacterium]|nr:hypothetical protein [Thermoanaerobaculia bacterium]
MSAVDRMSVLLVAFLVSSCATVWKGSDETIAVTSQPPGASAIIECKGFRTQGMTPARLTIPRKANGCSLAVSKDSFVTRAVALDTGFNGPYWGNFAGVAGVGLALGGSFGGADNFVIVSSALLGVLGLGGFVVDRMTGRAFHHMPDEINVTLQPAR